MTANVIPAPRCCAAIEAVKVATKDMNSFESAMYAWNAFADLAHELERELAVAKRGAWAWQQAAEDYWMVCGCRGCSQCEKVRELQTPPAEGG